MRVKTVSVEYQRTINLGNFQSAKIGVTLHADLESHDNDAAAAVLALQQEARESVRAEYLRLTKSSPAAGLPAAAQS